MTAVASLDVRTARQRAGKIREGIHNYLETLALIQQAWEERDWVTLGYDDWDQYVETEFSDARLRLPAEHRQKAVVELRLAGMSQRAISSTLGVSQPTVSRDLAGDSFESPGLPENATGLDGKRYAATQPARRSAPAVAPTAVEPEPDRPEWTPVEEPSPGLSGSNGSAAAEATGAAIPVAGASLPPRSAAPRMTQREYDQHHDEVQRRKDIAAAYRQAETIVDEFLAMVVTVVTGSRYGEKHLVSAAMVAKLREGVDLLEGEL